MLYSVVVCDLIFKLEDLRDIYNDQTAKKILLEIEALQKGNPRSPDWENKLIEMVQTRTKLLETPDLEKISQLQKHRHLSAHPILNQTSILYQPNKETVKAHIKNILEGILTKPPIFSARIFQDLIADLATNKDRFITDDELKRFLNAKYFKGLRTETFRDIFKKLWKFVFKLENDDANQNREINFKTLEIIFRANQVDILDLLRTEETHFNEIASGICTDYLFDLLFRNPKIYSALSDLNKQNIEIEAASSPVHKLMSWFTFDSFNDYAKQIISKFDDEPRFHLEPNEYQRLLELYKEFDNKPEFINLLNLLYFKSSSFDSADQNFYRIEKFLADYSPEQLIRLIEIINSNSQISGRGQAVYSNRIISKECEMKLPENFDYSKFYHFRT
ncbi:MAG: hypothetical protein EOO43_13875 [Flavobacterium sp.]|nr:MAG: hypothetical protein EOO43_13875 [Flavobacterium sp.]